MNLLMLTQGSQTQKTAKPHLIYKTFQKNIKLKREERDLLPGTRDQMRGLMTMITKEHEGTFWGNGNVLFPSSLPLFFPSANRHLFEQLEIWKAQTEVEI